MQDNNKSVRKRLYEIIEVASNDDKASFVYDLIMLIAILASIIPLAFKTYYPFFTVIDAVTSVLFVMDYLFRLITADYKLGDRRAVAFVMYPFTPLAVIDLISILPSITALNSGFKLLRVFRIFRTFRVFRVFKMFRYSRSVSIIAKVIKNSKDALIAVTTLAF
ncbi:MAG: ion transporter, partial [Oscillospiraceae bacterium]|nr:ion transporter [Oscillospiraceae bacterium]